MYSTYTCTCVVCQNHGTFDKATCNVHVDVQSAKTMALLTKLSVLKTQANSVCTCKSNATLGVFLSGAYLYITIFYLTEDGLK